MSKRIHILGVCGTFMGSLALLAKSLGFQVEGSDQNVYPPMSDQLREQGIELIEGYSSDCLKNNPDIVVVGNVIMRGNPAIEAVLDNQVDYLSGPEFLREYVLKGRHVLAVAGTHGKTTTSSMLAWILDYAGLSPGFLIGGVPLNFGVSARLGKSPVFVVEADEYDTSLFDKRSKFVHYRPSTLILNNLEFDHADIFKDVVQIQKHFHQLIRTVPGNALIVDNANDPLLQEAIDLGCWTPRESVNGPNSTWKVRSSGPMSFELLYDDSVVGKCEWQLMGEHNVLNALSAIVAATHVGVDASTSLEALSHFQNVKRRLELRGEVNGIYVYDDFAHHPTAIKLTIDGLRHQVGDERILAVTEFNSNTMRAGVHKEALGAAFEAADSVFCLKPKWPLEQSFKSKLPEVYESVDSLVEALARDAKPGDHILIMSNQAFGGIHEKLLERLSLSALEL